MRRVYPLPKKAHTVQNYKHKLQISIMSSTTSADTKTQTQVKSKSENFAHNSLNSNGISLVVPRVFPNWNYRKIKQVFIQCGWGYVERVDVVPVGRIPKGRFKTAFVHFRPNSWNNRDRQARDVLEKLSQGPQHNVQITYDEPWFWKVFISSAERPDEAPKAPPRPAIKLGEAVALTVDTSVGRHDHMEDVAEDSVDYDRSVQNDEEMRDA